MRILFVTDFYHPYSGGVEIHVRTVAAELAQRGHEVAVATMDTPSDEPSRERDGAVTVFTVGHSAERSGVGFAHRPWAPPLPDPLAMRALRRIIRSYRPDVIHGHDWLARSALPRIVSGHTPVVTSLHYYTRTCAKKTLWRDGSACDGPGLLRCLRCAGEHYGRAKGAAVTLGVRVGAWLEDRRTARWVSVSGATATGNGVDGRPNAVVIANPLGSEPVGCSTLPAQREPEVPPQVPDGPFVLFVGDLRPEKGISVLAAAVDRLRTEHADDTPLVVAGERLSPEPVLPVGTIELGPVDHDVVQALWRRAAVGVVPSLWPEPFGLVAIEAMAAGCPLVASAIGGLKEILGDGRAVLVAPGDHRALAEAIDRLLSDDAERAALSARAGAAATRYAVGPIVDAIEHEYRLALG